MKILKGKKYRVLSAVSKYSFVLVFVFMILMPMVFVRAVTVYDNENGWVDSSTLTNTTSTATVNTSTTTTGTAATSNAGTVKSTATGVNIDAKIKNPLGGDMDTIPKFIEAIINIVLIVGIPLLVLAIIYAGFLFVKAQGNSGELEIAKRTLLYTVIGGALLLGAFVIASAIGKTVEDIKSTT